MAIRIVRLGTPRAPGERPRLGTVRRPPRGVKKTDYSRRDFFDVWLPEFAPSAAVVSCALGEPWTPGRWQRYARRYRREMAEPRARHLIGTLAAPSHHSSFSVGCYCKGETRCHRGLLRELLKLAGADIAK